jgi:nucleotide-binding universal stress UspA family protein
MHELKRILVPTDLQDTTDANAASAVFLARAFDSRILLLHVVPELLSDVGTDDAGEESVTALLEDLKVRIEADGAFVEDVALLSGKASYRICQYAEQKNANLIVLGASRGRKQDVRLGVTARRVLRNSVKPVWLVAQPGSAPPTSILCPVDGSPAAHRALHNAIRLAKQFDARLTLLRVREAMPEIYARMIRPDDTSSTRELKRMRSDLNALVRGFDVTGVEVQTQVREGSSHAEILSAVVEFKCDLVVMGAEVVSGEDILASRLTAAIDSIRGHMQEGESLLRTGSPLESLAEYEQCLLDEPTYAPAWEGMAAAYESLGDLNKADRCKESAQRIRGTIW